MAHEVEQMAYAHVEGSTEEAYQHPWHKFDTNDRSVPLHPDATPQEMLVAAGLNWTVERAPSYYEVDGEKIPSGDVVLYRSDTKAKLSNVTETWHEVQNEEFVNFFHEFCVEGSMEMNTMGSLRGGQRVFGMAKIKNQEFALARGKDIVQAYCLFSNPHQYGMTVDLRFVMNRVVCMNTLVAALGETQFGIKLNHRKPFDHEEVKRLLGISQTNMNSYQEAAKFLASKKFSVDALKEYYSELFPSASKKKDEEGNIKMSRSAKTALEILETQPGHEFEEGSWWHAYNGVTYMVDHLKSRNQDNRMDSAWFGWGRQLKIKALDKAVAMAEKA